MKYRHELKQQISHADKLVLEQRLKAVLKPDCHAKEGVYEVSSLYFDNLGDKVWKEKMNGINHREKFRLRYYNRNTSEIKLEKKSKHNGLCLKQSVDLTVEQAQAMINGEFNWMSQSNEPLLREFCMKIRRDGLQPKTVVKYTRAPFVFRPGNVRVTLDYDIRTGRMCKDFLEASCITVPVDDNPIILEVKWDEYLPDIVKDVVRLRHGGREAFSKYAVCRMYD